MRRWSAFAFRASLIAFGFSAPSFSGELHYRVQNGDTLGQLAHTLNQTPIWGSSGAVRRLEAYNNLQQRKRGANLIRAKEKIRLDSQLKEAIDSMKNSVAFLKVQDNGQLEFICSVESLNSWNKWAQQVHDKRDPYGDSFLAFFRRCRDKLLPQLAHESSTIGREPANENTNSAKLIAQTSIKPLPATEEKHPSAPATPEESSDRLKSALGIFALTSFLDFKSIDISNNQARVLSNQNIGAEIEWTLWWTSKIDTRIEAQLQRLSFQEVPGLSGSKLNPLISSLQLSAGLLAWNRLLIRPFVAFGTEQHLRAPNVGEVTGDNVQRLRFGAEAEIDLLRFKNGRFVALGALRPGASSSNGSYTLENDLLWDAGLGFRQKLSDTTVVMDLGYQQSSTDSSISTQKNRWVYGRFGVEFNYGSK